MSHGIDRSEGGGKWINREILYEVSRHQSKSFFRNEKVQGEKRSQHRRQHFPTLQFLMNCRLKEDQLESKKLFTAFPFKNSENLERLKCVCKFKKSESMNYFRQLLNQAGSRVTNISQVVPKLSRLCLNVIAENLHDYNFEILQQIANCLLDEDVAYLAVKSTEYGTLTDENVNLVANVDSKLLVLNQFVTVNGIQQLFSSCGQLYIDTSEVFNEEWEEFDASRIRVGESFVHLEDIYLMGTEIDCATLTLLGKSAPNIMNLFLHRNSIIASDLQDGESGRDSVSCCGNLLSSLLEYYQCLSYIEISYCDWISIEALQLWGNAISHGRHCGGSVLPSLRCMKIVGYKRFHEEILMIHGASKTEGQTACTQHEMECQTIIRQFAGACNIVLLIE